MMSNSFVQFALKASLMFTVFGIALTYRHGELRYFRNRRGLLLRSLVAMHVVMPVIALVLTSVIPVHPAVRLALVALMISPIPAALPTKALGIGDETSYALSLFIIASLLSVVLVPISVAIIGMVYGASMHVPPRAVAQVVFSGVVLPLTIGMAGARAAPTAAARISGPIVKLANIVLLLAVVPLIVKMWPAIRELLGNGTIVIILALLAIAMGVGYAFGGPNRNDRAVLGFANSSRHPGVAVVIAAATFPAETTAPAAVLLTALLSVLLSKPYFRLTAGQRRSRGISGPAMYAGDRPSR